MNQLLDNLTSADYSVVPVTGKIKLYAKAQRKIVLGLEFKCSIASSVHTEPHSPQWLFVMEIFPIFWVFCI